MDRKDMLKDIVRAYQKYPNRVAFVIDDISYSYQEVFSRVQGIVPLVQGDRGIIIGIVAEALYRNLRLDIGGIVIGENLCHFTPRLPEQPEQNYRGDYQNEPGAL